MGSHSGRFGANFDPSSEAEGRGLSAQFDLDIGSATFTSISAYRENDFNASADVDFLPADILIESVDYDFETFTQSFNSLTTRCLRWLVGAYYMDEDNLR